MVQDESLVRVPMDKPSPEALEILNNAKRRAVAADASIEARAFQLFAQCLFIAAEIPTDTLLDVAARAFRVARLFEGVAAHERKREATS